jgi:hypothetical protein
MADMKTVGLTTLIMMGLVSAGAITVGYFNTPHYFCDVRPELGVKTCDTLSTYGVANGKCTSNGVGFICKSGWAKVVNDTISNAPPAPKQVAGQAYSCNSVECTPII